MSIKIYVKVITETEKAMLVDIVDLETEESLHSKNLWIPKSQILETKEITGELEIRTMAITDWIANEKEIIGEEIEI